MVKYGHIGSSPLLGWKKSQQKRFGATTENLSETSEKMEADHSELQWNQTPKGSTKSVHICPSFWPT